MARFINGRLLPTFLPTLPTKETKPNLEKLMKDFVKTQYCLAHRLQQVEGSLSRQSTSQNKKEILGVFTNQVSKGLYDAFGYQPTSEPRKRKNQLRREQCCFTCQGVWIPNNTCESPDENEAMC